MRPRIYHRLFVLSALSAFLVSAVLPNFAQESDPIVQLSKDINPPRPINTPEPEYPSGAHSRGNCAASVTVDQHGNPINPTIIRCTDPLFEKNTISAINRFRFKPATRHDGTPVSVRINVVIAFRHDAREGNTHEGLTPSTIQVSFRTPPGASSSEPDENGIYPYSPLFETGGSAPQITSYHGERFGDIAQTTPAGTACDVLITIDRKGKPGESKLIHCSDSRLDDVVLDMLMKSRYKPARLNGKAVAFRGLMTITYKGYSSEAP